MIPRINGGGYPRFLIKDIKPGMIACYGVDDDMTVLILSNVPDVARFGNKQNRLGRRIKMFGCLVAPTEYEYCKIMECWFDLDDSLSIMIDENGNYMKINE